MHHGGIRPANRESCASRVGEDLSYSMLFLYLTGVLLWLVYGIRVHAVAVMWANAMAGLLVLISIVLKANPPAKKLDAAAKTAHRG